MFVRPHLYVVPRDASALRLTDRLAISRVTTISYKY
jgi:hypothetical protein